MKIIISKITSIVASLAILVISLKTLKNGYHSIVVSTSFIIIMYKTTKNFISIELNEENNKIKESFQDLRGRFQNEEIKVEIDMKDYGANLRVYVISKEAEVLDITIKGLMNYLETKKEMDLYKTVQVQRLNKKSEIFRARLIMKLNVIQERLAHR